MIAVKIALSIICLIIMAFCIRLSGELIIKKVFIKFSSIVSVVKVTPKVIKYIINEWYKYFTGLRKDYKSCLNKGILFFKKDYLNVLIAFSISGYFFLILLKDIANTYNYRNHIMDNWINLVIIITSLIFFTCMLIKYFRRDNVIDYIVRIIAIYLILLLIGMIAILVFVNLNRTKIELYSIPISLSVFIVISVAGIYFSTIFFKSKILMLVFTITIYIFIICCSGIIFGMFYCIFYGIDSREIIALSKSGQRCMVLIKCIRISIGYFYSYPDSKVLGFVSVFQYFLGKFLDAFMLGYILYKFTDDRKGLITNK
ncbi:hypothetical protein ACJDU8_02285 [Clostridium sp. WILCCON 0269]|uniref:Uncharacterized protein n=1 Tax=Candidatus Clostridium eludens TaxID=3381663 RepID=A0ABW8SEF3_9CLOT